MDKVQVTPSSVERFIKEAKARKVVGSQIPAFFLKFFELESVNELSPRELDMANKKLSQYRYPTLDGSEVYLHNLDDQNSLLSRKIGN